MRILVLGSGAREHALAWKLSLRTRRYLRHSALPATRESRAPFPTVPLDILDTDAVIRLVDRERIDLTVVGPEAPLGRGLADRLRSGGPPVFGPTRARGPARNQQGLREGLHAAPSRADRALPGLHDRGRGARGDSFRRVWRRARRQGRRSRRRQGRRRGRRIAPPPKPP